MAGLSNRFLAHVSGLYFVRADDLRQAYFLATTKKELPESIPVALNLISIELTAARAALADCHAMLDETRAALDEARKALGHKTDALIAAQNAHAAIHSALFDQHKLLLRRDEAIAGRDEVIAGKDSIIREKDEALSVMETEIHRLMGDVADLSRKYYYLPNTSTMQDRIEHLGRWLSVKDVAHFGKIRIGGPNDGGYVCVDDFDAVNSAISLGIGNDVSWDVAVADRDIKVFQYDNTIAHAPILHKNFVFHQTRVSNVAGEGVETLNTLLIKHEISTPLCAIAKVDIEGDEWGVFDDATPESLSVFSQIVIEFHHLERLAATSFFERVCRVSEKLGRLFEPVHIHANNCCPLLVIGNKLFPSVFEVTFVNRAKYSLSESKEVFPSVLDAPNLPDRSDHELGRFKY